MKLSRCISSLNCSLFTDSATLQYVGEALWKQKGYSHMHKHSGFPHGRRHQNAALPGFEPSNIRQLGRRCHQLNHRGAVLTAVHIIATIGFFSAAAVNRTIIIFKIHILSILTATYLQQPPQHNLCTIGATHGSAAIPLFVVDTAGAVRRQYLKTSYGSTKW